MLILFSAKTVSLTYGHGHPLSKLLGCGLQTLVTLRAELSVKCTSVPHLHLAVSVLCRIGLHRTCGGPHQAYMRQTWWKAGLREHDSSYRFQNVLVDSLVAKGFQMLPVKGGFTCARTTTEDHDVEGVLLGE